MINVNFLESAPSVENIINIFGEGGWMCKLPLEGVATGGWDVFNDRRIYDWNDIYPVAGKKILELGSSECAHAYMLEKLGAASVTCIESHQVYFLKGMVVKDLFGLKAKLLLGDFRAYLKDCNERFDIVLASGVLYHMTDPIRLINDIARVADNAFVWTHYYSEERKNCNTVFEKEPIPLSEKYSGYKQYYGDTSSKNFPGGTRPYSVFMKRDDIIAALKDAGFINVTVIEDKLMEDNPNFTPLVTLFASKHGTPGNNETMVSNAVMEAALREQREAFEKSTSWKVTRPLRAVKKAIFPNK